MQPQTFIHTLTLVVSIGVLQIAQAVVPPPDGGYPGRNTAEGHKALFSLTTGTDNVALGYLSLQALTTGSLNTGVGAWTLALNTADNNTGCGAAALLLNGTGTNNTAVGTAALLFNTIGEGNTATGAFALYNNIEGDFNTANGEFALSSNSLGERNTAIGNSALSFNTEGNRNTAVGNPALLLNTTGTDNTAIGTFALRSNTSGDQNAAVGVAALFSNTANGNTASGYLALTSNTTGPHNTATGTGALANNTTGGFNIAVGDGAGSLLTTGDFNICIGNSGDGGESRVIRIGTVGGHTQTFIAGIYGSNYGPADLPVRIGNDGKLGTLASSARFKKDIKPMDNASDAILALKPVTFHYKSDSKGTSQFGLIAEEVAEVHPDLVVRDENGAIYSVRYEAVNAMLLNEFLKERRTVQEQGATIKRLEKQIYALAAGLQRVSAELAAASPSRGGLELNKYAPQLAASNRD